MAPALLAHGSWTPEEDAFCNHNYFEERDVPVTLPSPTVPHISTLDTKDYHPASDEALVSDIVRSLKRSGGCVIRNFISEESLAQCEIEIRPYLDTTKQADGECPKILNTLCN